MPNIIWNHPNSRQSPWPKFKVYFRSRFSYYSESKCNPNANVGVSYYLIAFWPNRFVMQYCQATHFQRFKSWTWPADCRTICGIVKTSLSLLSHHNSEQMNNNSLKVIRFVPQFCRNLPVKALTKHLKMFTDSCGIESFGCFDGTDDVLLLLLLLLINTIFALPNFPRGFCRQYHLRPMFKELRYVTYFKTMDTDNCVAPPMPFVYWFCLQNMQSNKNKTYRGRGKRLSVSILL